MASWVANKPLRIALRWQLLAAILVPVVLVLVADSQSAVSAFLGGMVSVISSATFALIVSRHKGYTAGGTIRTALKAEAVKIILTIVLLWVVFKFYKDLNALVFIGTFILTVIMHSLALFVSDNKDLNSQTKI